MEVICLEDEAFYALFNKVIKYVQQNHEAKEDKWISGEEAMKLLGITSKTTLKKFRDEGKIRFTQPERKIILYDKDSLLGFLDKNSNETF